MAMLLACRCPFSPEKEAASACRKHHYNVGYAITTTKREEWAAVRLLAILTTENNNEQRDAYRKRRTRGAGRR